MDPIPTPSASERYWREVFADGVELMQLPLQRNRPPVPSFLRDTVTTRINAGTQAELQRLAARSGIAVQPAILAAMHAVVRRYAEQSRTIIGVTGVESFRDGRDLCLPTRVEWSPDKAPSGRDLIQAMMRHLDDAAAHRDIAVRTLNEWFGLPDALGSRLFNIAVAFRHPGDVDMRSVAVDEVLARCDLVFDVDLAAGSLLADFDAELFSAVTATRFLGHISALLDALVENPETAVSQLPMVTGEERRLIVDGWNATARNYPRDVCLHDLIAAQVERTPEAIAVVFEDQRLTYRELDARANRVAHALQARGIGPDCAVGVCLHRSLELVVALLGVLKAGGAYVPIEPGQPADRLAFMIEDSAITLLLTTADLAPALPAFAGSVLAIDDDAPGLAGLPSTAPPTAVRADHLAYVIYTSGSTGRPKGAQNEHRGIVNRLLWMQDQYRLQPGEGVLQKTPFGFDVSVWEFFWPLMTGARLVLARPGGHHDPAYLVEVIKAQDVAILHFVPSMLRVFLETPRLEECASVRDVICSGEALPADVLRAFHAAWPARLHNLYGPTEAAVDVTSWTSPGKPVVSVPIGRPVANTQCYILDSHRQLAPIGAAGELYLGGIQVGRGYHRRPDLTAARFVADVINPAAGGRLYRTGDQCRYTEDGEIEYLGRLDDQVKIRGFRIELGEIESVLAEHDSIAASVVTVSSTGQGVRLAAFVVPEAGATIDGAALRAHLARRLPDYMVPAAWIAIDTIPLNANGKVDRRALPPVPEHEPARPRVTKTIALSDCEKRIAEIWAAVLGAGGVGRDENFFEVGGDSLTLVQVRHRIQDQFHVAVSIAAMFQHPTIAALARLIGDRPLPGGEPAVPPTANRAARQRDAMQRFRAASARRAQA